MKRLFLSAAIAATFVPAASHATALYLVDNFATAVGDPFATKLDRGTSQSNPLPADFVQTRDYTLNGYGFTREINFSLKQDDATGSTNVAWLKVGAPANGLSMTNSDKTRSTLDLTYDVKSLANIINAAPSSATFVVTFSDGASVANPTLANATMTIGGTTTGLGGYSLTQNIPAVVVANALHFNLAGITLDPLLPNKLKFSFTGQAGYDITISSIGVEVPEPAMLGLFGLGAIGLGIARRRKR